MRLLSTLVKGVSQVAHAQSYRLKTFVEFLRLLQECRSAAILHSTFPYFAVRTDFADLALSSPIQVRAD